MVHVFTVKHSTSRVVVLDSSSDDDSKSEGVPQIYKSQTTLIRTQLLILDYKQFKAARLIQKIIRGWLVRNEMNKRNNAALVIQRAWWRYTSKSFQTTMAQQMLQTKIVDTYNISSVKIQSLYRGWYSRKYHNNMIYLNIVQGRALEDVLRCMVFKMYKLNSQNELPGILSFRDKDCLGKIEKFISTLSYRLFNRFVSNHLDVITSMQKERRNEFQHSQLYTKVPYHGVSLTDPYAPDSFDPALKIYNNKESDCARAFKNGLDCRTAGDYKRLRKLLEHILEKRLMKEKMFCEDMLIRILNWNVWRNYDQEDMDVLLDSTVSEFIGAIKEYLQAGHYIQNCDCQQDCVKR